MSTILDTFRSLFTSQGQTAVLALLNAVLGALVAFNVVLTQTQMGAITLVANTLFGLLVVLFGPAVAAQAKTLKAKGAAK